MSVKIGSGYNFVVNNNLTAKPGGGIVRAVAVYDAADILSYPGSGDTWFDISGNGHHGTMHNVVFSNSNNGIMQFNGTNGYVSIGNVIDNSPYTISAVVKRNVTTGARNIVSTNESPFWFNGNNLGGGFNNNFSNVYFNVGNNLDWMYVAIVFDGTYLKLYQNGSLVNMQLSYGGYYKSQPTFIGAHSSPGPNDPISFFDGYISSIRIYNVALTEEQILSDYESMFMVVSSGTTTTSTSTTTTPAPTTTTTSTTTTSTTTTTPAPTTTTTTTPSPVLTNLVLYYDPSNSSSYSGSGTTINDLSGNSLSGTLSNVTFTSPYFSFNGSSSQIGISDNSLLEPGTGDWTMEVWANYTNFNSSAVIIGKFNSGGASDDVSYSIRSNTSGGLFAQYGNGITHANSTNYTLSANQWYHIVVVWTNISANTIKLYINDVYQNQASHSFSSLLNTTTGLYLGSYNNGEYSQYFNGKMGIVRIYNKSLTDAEISSNFESSRTKYNI
jgi:hypothetical protein